MFYNKHWAIDNSIIAQGMFEKRSSIRLLLKQTRETDAAAETDHMHCDLVKPIKWTRPTYLPKFYPVQFF